MRNFYRTVVETRTAFHFWVSVACIVLLLALIVAKAVSGPDWAYIAVAGLWVLAITLGFWGTYVAAVARRDALKLKESANRRLNVMWMLVLEMDELLALAFPTAPVNVHGTGKALSYDLHGIHWWWRIAPGDKVVLSTYRDGLATKEPVEVSIDATDRLIMMQFEAAPDIPVSVEKFLEALDTIDEREA